MFPPEFSALNFFFSGNFRLWNFCLWTFVKKKIAEKVSEIKIDLKNFESKKKKKKKKILGPKNSAAENFQFKKY